MKKKKYKAQLKKLTTKSNQPRTGISQRLLTPFEDTSAR